MFFYFSEKSYADLDAFKNLELPQTSTVTNIKNVNMPRLNVNTLPSVSFTETRNTEVYVEGELGQGAINFGNIFLIFRKDEKGFIHPTGRAVALETTKKDGKKFIKLICYKFINNLFPSSGDRLVYLGEPINEHEKGDIKHILLSKINLDRELDDMYHGVMAIRTVLGKNNLGGTSSGDSNAFKKTSSSFPMYGFGYTWWFFFLPQLGFDVEYRRGLNIKTISYFEKVENSSLSNTTLSLMFRMRLFKLPAMIHVKYFIDRFNTTNPDDFIIASKYTGLSFFTQWHFPYQFTILPLGFAKMVFQDIEFGFGYTPIINVKDTDFERGTNCSANSLRYHAGILFNFETSKFDFVKDIFFGFVIDMTTYSFNFSGPTTGGIIAGGSNTERYFYYGFIIKYVFADPFEDF